MGDMQALRTLIDAPELHTGFLAGVAALLVTAIVVLALRAGGARHETRSGRTRPGLVGPALVVATLVGIGGLGPFDQVWPVPTRVVLALAGLWLAGEIGARTTPPIGVVLALAAGIALVDPAAHFPVWVALILALGPAIAGTAVADFDRRAARRGLGPLLLLVSIGGLYTTVPDTELALVLLGAAIPITLLAWPWVCARLGSGGSYAAIGLFLWVATLEGSGRVGSIVGAVATLALLVLEPLGRLLAPRLAVERLPQFLTAERVKPGVLIVGQLLLVAWAARVAGLVVDPIAALVLALPVLAVGIAIGAGASVRPPESSDHRRRRRHQRDATFDHDDRPPRGDPWMN
jgi:hypothetical protein